MWRQGATGVKGDDAEAVAVGQSEGVVEVKKQCFLGFYGQTGVLGIDQQTNGLQADRGQVHAFFLTGLAAFDSDAAFAAEFTAPAQGGVGSFETFHSHDHTLTHHETLPDVVEPETGGNGPAKGDISQNLGTGRGAGKQTGGTVQTGGEGRGRNNSKTFAFQIGQYGTQEGVVAFAGEFEEQAHGAQVGTQVKGFRLVDASGETEGVHAFAAKEGDELVDLAKMQELKGVGHLGQIGGAVPMKPAHRNKGPGFTGILGNEAGKLSAACDDADALVHRYVTRQGGAGGNAPYSTALPMRFQRMLSKPCHDQ